MITAKELRRAAELLRCVDLGTAREANILAEKLLNLSEQPEPTEQEVEQKIADMIECLRDWPDMCEMYSERAADMLESLSSRLAAERKDAERYRWLENRCLAADFDYGERHECVIVFRWPADARIGQNLTVAIDAAIAESTK